MRLLRKYNQPKIDQNLHVEELNLPKCKKKKHVQMMM